MRIMKIRNGLIILLCHAIFLSQLHVSAFAARFVDPVAVSFAAAVPINAQSVIQLQGSDGDGTALIYAIVANPATGTLSNLNATTGAVMMACGGKRIWCATSLRLRMVAKKCKVSISESQRRKL